MKNTVQLDGYLDLFSGYGGFHKALEEAGFSFKNTYFSEIDKHAIANYTYNFPNSQYVGSIQSIRRSTIGKLDLVTFGWPCQDNSIAGKRKGQQPGTRSGLLYEAVRIVNEFKPRNFIAENVKGLYSVNGGVDFKNAVEVLAYLNESLPQYDIEMQLCNTRWVLPQNRERLFFVGHLITSGGSGRKVFPIGEGAGMGDRPSTTSKEIHEPAQTMTARQYSSWNGNYVALTETRTDEAKDIRRENMKNGRDFSPRRGKELTPRTDGVMNTLTGTQTKEHLILNIPSNTTKGYDEACEGDSINLSMPNSTTRRGRVGKGVAQTLDTQCNQGVIQVNPSKESGGKQPYQQNRVYNPIGDSPALNTDGRNLKIQIGAMRGRNPENTSDRTVGAPTEQRLEVNKDGVSNTLTSVQKDNLVITQNGHGFVKQSDSDICPTIMGSSIAHNVFVNRIRRLTPIETERLQGLSDNWTKYGNYTDGVKEISDSQRYRLCGNGVTKHIVLVMAKRLFDLNYRTT